MSLKYISTGIENASPLSWQVADNGSVHIDLMYDHERESPNRATLHWHFEVQGDPGSELTLILKNHDNIWNGRPGSPIRGRAKSAFSIDGKRWEVLEGRWLEEQNWLELNVHLGEGQITLAALEPYRLSDLDRLLDEIEGHPRVDVTCIGRTVQGQPLEMVRVGDPGAPFRLFIRARAHPWETGGNWVLEGLIRRLLKEEEPGFCLFTMPIANKDGVARGGSRFNVQGKDLNRNWDAPADPERAPENHALEQWLLGLDQLPHLAVDLHNDNGGKLLVGLPEGDSSHYLNQMETLESALRAHTWFREGSSVSSEPNYGSFNTGLRSRYGFPAVTLELNASWSKGLDKAPLGEDWVLMGGQMVDAFKAYAVAAGH